MVDMDRVDMKMLGLQITLKISGLRLNDLFLILGRSAGPSWLILLHTWYWLESHGWLYLGETSAGTGMP